jgi:predicted phage terminase large subunit-like protein
MLPINTPIGLAGAITGYKYDNPAHLQLIQAFLIELTSQENKRIMITIPPRHGKSELTSKYFPAWYMLNFPHKRIILASYGSSFASSWCIKAKDVYEQIKPNNLTISRQDEWITKEGGSMSSAGIGGPITGKGADVFIIDDPVKNFEEAESKTYREKSYEWFRSVALTRLEPKGSVILIMTRWHNDDLGGKILKDDTTNEWIKIDIPAIAEDNDVLGRQVGEALWPNRFDINQLNRIKLNSGSYVFSSLYQQKPIASDYQIFNLSWFRTYNYLPTNFEYKMQVWDTAFKNSQENDFSVCITLGVNKDGIYVIDLYRDKPLFPELRRKVKEQFIKHFPNIVGIEDAGSGQSIIQDIKDNERQVPLIEIQAKNKVIRAHAVTSIIENGELYLPAEADWLTNFKNELQDFPKGSHDDQVDVLTMGLEYLKQILNEIKYPINSYDIKKRLSNKSSKYTGF